MDPVVDGFSLNAFRTVAPEDRAGLKQLCCYGLRAPCDRCDRGPDSTGPFHPAHFSGNWTPTDPCHTLENPTFSQSLFLDIRLTLGDSTVRRPKRLESSYTHMKSQLLFFVGLLVISFPVFAGERLRPTDVLDNGKIEVDIGVGRLRLPWVVNFGGWTRTYSNTEIVGFFDAAIGLGHDVDVVVGIPHVYKSYGPGSEDGFGWNVPRPLS